MGWIIEPDQNIQVLWRLDGRVNGGQDLVAEWVEPKRIKGFACVFASKSVD